MSAVISPGGTRAFLRQLLTVPVIIAAVLTLALYLAFDLRAGGDQSSLITVKLNTPTSVAQMFGWPYVIWMVVLDVALALVSGVLLVQSYRAIRARRNGGAAGACSTGSGLLLGFSMFTCPGCTLPLLGTLGITFVSTSLPLYGLEFKILTLLLITGALVWIHRQQRRDVTDSTEDTGDVAPQGV